MASLKQCVAAFRFLTIIPLPGSFGSDGEDLRGAMVFFPVVGIVLGMLGAAAAWIAWHLFPPLVASVLVTLALLSFSGALHLDGLADCADGFFSARDRNRILEIMRDSRIGVMGVVAVVIILLLKVSALSEMDSGQAVKAALLMPLAGRSALVIMMFLLPYVRRDGGMGTPFYAERSGWALTAALFCLFGAFLLVMGAPGMLTAMIVLAVVFLFSRQCHRKIGGATGDTLGAACEIVEALIPLCMLVGFAR